MAHDTSVTRRTFYVILLGIYAVMVGLITLAPITGSLSTAPSWIPLAQIWYLLTSPQEAFYTSIGQVAGNVALFVPLGWLLPAIWKQLRSASRTGGGSSYVLYRDRALPATRPDRALVGNGRRSPQHRGSRAGHRDVLGCALGVTVEDPLRRPPQNGGRRQSPDPLHNRPASVQERQQEGGLSAPNGTAVSIAKLTTAHSLTRQGR